jgi:O-antigen/teichoic acid export membrane protein
MMRRAIDRLRAATGHRVLADNVPLQIGQAITIGVQAATSVILLRALGPGTVGLYAMSVALAASVALFDLSGARGLAVAELARARGAAAPERVAAILARFLRLGALVRVPLVAVFVVLGPLVSTWLFGREDAGLWARWFCLPLAIDLPFDLLVIVLQGNGDMRRLARVESGRAILTALCTITVLIAGLGLGGLALVLVGISIGASAWAAGVYRQLSARDPTLPAWGDVLRGARHPGKDAASWAGFAIAIEKNLSNLGGHLPMLMVGALRPEAAGYFSAAIRTMSLPYPLVSAFARYLDMLLPYRMGESVAAARRTFSRATLGAGGVWAIVTVGMVLVAPVLLVRLAGADYAPAVPALYPLALQSLATGAGVAIGAALRALQRPAHGIGLQAISIVATVPIGYALIADSGAVGAAWFHALRYLLLTLAGVGWVLWLTRPGGPRDEAATTRPGRARR